MFTFIFLQALAKSFGVDAQIVNDLKFPAADREDREDLAVGSHGLTSGRDRDVAEPSAPRDTSKWVSVSMRRNSIGSGPVPILGAAAAPAPDQSSVPVWLPKDRGMVRSVLDVYFSRLNFHRPVFTRGEFEPTLDALYDGQLMVHDAGYVCSAYLILALGTLSELNHRVNGMEKDGGQGAASPTTPKKIMPPDWPEHEEFFERALSVKPDLRVTVSSLQALILLQWYLYTEVSVQRLDFDLDEVQKLMLYFLYDSDRDAHSGASSEALSGLRLSLACTMTPLRRTTCSLKRSVSCASAFGVSFSYMIVAHRFCLGARLRLRRVTRTRPAHHVARAAARISPSTSCSVHRSQRFRRTSSIVYMHQPGRLRTRSCAMPPGLSRAWLSSGGSSLIITDVFLAAPRSGPLRGGRSLYRISPKTMA